MVLVDYLPTGPPSTLPSLPVLGGDLKSLSCNRCCPGRSSRGSVGGRAADKSIGPGGSPAADSRLTLSPLLKEKGEEFVLSLCSKNTDVIVDINNLDHFSLFCS